MTASETIATPSRRPNPLYFTSFFRSLLWSGLSLLLVAGQISQAAEPFTDKRQLGTKYSPLKQINTANVAGLELAWEYHTGDMSDAKDSVIAFEDEPSLIAGNLVVCSISRHLIALDPATGQERWRYDPGTPAAVAMKKCRGISAWVDDTAPPDDHCKTRIFLGTADYRLVAIGATDGKPCLGFGDGGEVQMAPSKPVRFTGEVAATSRPAVVNGVVVVGSSVTDDLRLDAPSGRVLAFDARTGAALWEFDPVPRDPADPAMATWLKGTTDGHGGANVWASMAVDESLDLVYLPTTSVSIDFYGATRPGNNHYADSIVALRGASGEVAWHFQLVHHDIWDYDTPSQPLLVDLPYNGKSVPALVQNTKTGLIFVFNRETGEPLIPYVERPVPQHGAVPEEQWLSPTQPFPVGMPVLSPQSLYPDDAWGFTPIDRWLCRSAIEEHNHGPIYTPPSERGTIMQPGPAGGPNWGGGAYDPETHIMVVPSARMPMIVTMIRREDAKLEEGQAIEARTSMTFPNEGVPYVTRLEPLLSPFLGTPCTAPPWAVLTAVDLARGEVLWEVPLGSIHKMAPVPIPWEWNLGTPGAGGPLVTAGGLVFIGYTMDDKLRAFDLRSGEVLWKTDLPAAGMATPVTYESQGQQYVVLTAGGHSMYGTSMGDSVMAYRLKH